MTKFPEPVAACATALDSRNNRFKHLITAARFGVLVRTLIVVIEFLGYFFWGSNALLMDAIASSLDIACSLFLMIALFLASRPPDQNHPFGHGRYEPLAGMLLGVLLTVIGVTMALQQGYLAVEHEVQEVLPIHLWVIPFGAIVLLEICFRITRFAAKKQNSPALFADAVHYRIDALTSLFAMIALIVGVMIPEYAAVFDHLGAVVIALLMVGLGLMTARKNVRQLLDHTPDEEYFSLVRKAAMRVDGVLGTEKVRIQLYGPDAHVDIDVEVLPNLSVEAAHRISQFVRAEIQNAWPKVRDVTVHIEPFYPGDH